MKKKNEADLKAIARDAMRKYGFEPDFPDMVRKEVRDIGETPLGSERGDTRDLTGLLWSSIDNYDSMDLDQIEYCEGDSGREVLVRVAIADVDYFVRKGSPTDRHASHTGRQYTLEWRRSRCFLMNSRRGYHRFFPGGDKRAMVIEYTVLADGQSIMAIFSGQLYEPG